MHMAAGGKMQVLAISRVGPAAPWPPVRGAHEPELHQPPARHHPRVPRIPRPRTPGTPDLAVAPRKLKPPRRPPPTPCSSTSLPASPSSSPCFSSPPRGGRVIFESYASVHRFRLLRRLRLPRSTASASGRRISPYAKDDPAAKYTLSGPAAGVGSSLEWAGDAKIGAGRMTITESRPDELVRIKLNSSSPGTAPTRRTSFFARAAPAPKSPGPCP